MKLTITGQKELSATLRKLPKQMLDATAVGEYNAAQAVMAVAKARAPFESGALEESAWVSDIKYSAQSASVQMGFGGDATPYMVAQHENESYQHPGTSTKTTNLGRAAQGRAKFLSSAIEDMAKETAATIRAAVNRFIRTGRLPRTEGPITKRGP